MRLANLFAASIAVFACLTFLSVGKFSYADIYGTDCRNSYSTNFARPLPACAEDAQPFLTPTGYNACSTSPCGLCCTYNLE